MPYSAKAVANFFLDIADAEKKPVSPMKLLKLVYFAHGWHLALKGEPLIDEAIEAWKFGPVVPSLYQTFKRFGMDPITDRALNYIRVGDEYRACQASLPDDAWLAAFLRRIWEVYGHLSAAQLSNLTHEPGTPWTLAWEGGAKHIRGSDIDNATIREYFTSKRAQPAAA